MLSTMAGPLPYPNRYRHIYVSVISWSVKTLRTSVSKHGERQQKST